MKIKPAFGLFLALCTTIPLLAQIPVDNQNGKVAATEPTSRVAPPAAVAEMVNLEAERAAIRRTLIAELKAAEKQAAETAKTQGKAAATAIHAESVAKQQAQSARLQQIEARLNELKPETKATKPTDAR